MTTSLTQFSRPMIAEHITTGTIIVVDGDEWIALEDAQIQPLTPGQPAGVLVLVSAFPVTDHRTYTLSLGLTERVPAIGQV